MRFAAQRLSNLRENTYFAGVTVHGIYCVRWIGSLTVCDLTGTIFKINQPIKFEC
jgi:hypothetical protein